MVGTNEPRRLRVHRAPFLFGPNYLSSADEWQRSFSDLVRSVCATEKVSYALITSDQFRLTLTFGNLDFAIDAYDGIFDLTEQSTFEDDDLSNTAWGGVGDVPDDFLSQLTSHHVPKKFRSVVFASVKPIATALWFQMRSRFKRAIADGLAEIYARPGSPLSDFVRIEADAFEYFAVGRGERPLHSTELDEAKGPRGERLFSVGVVPVERRVLAPAKKTKPGRKRQYDKAMLAGHLDNLMEHHSHFSSDDPEWNAQARLVEKAIEFCSQKFGIDLALSTAKTEAKEAADRYRVRFPAEN